MESNQSIEVLNSLITINNDRVQGYETAIEETKDQDLKTLFAQFIQTSQQCRSELSSVVTNLGGEPNDGTRIDGEIYRVWMDFKALVTGKDRKAILNSCEFGEDVAVKAYQKALKDEDLSSEHRSIVSLQFSKIKADHDKVKSLRDSLVHA